VTGGQLSVVSADGTRHGVALTAGAGQPAELAWSPDGRWLAFLREGPFAAGPAGGTGSLWLVPAGGGSAHRVLSGAEVGTFAWDPARDVLAVAEVAGPGASAHPLVTVPIPASGHPGDAVAPGDLTGGSVTSLAWSASGDRLAVGVDFTTDAGAIGDLDLLRIADGPGSRPQVAASSRSHGFDLAGWWPSGRGVLYWQDNAFSASIAADGLPLVARDLRTGATHTLATTLTYPSWLAWSPGGNSLALVAGIGRVVWGGDKHVVVCEVQSGSCRAVPQPPDRASIDPTWTPGGRLIWVEAAGSPQPDGGVPPGVRHAGSEPYSWQSTEAWAATGRVEAAGTSGGKPTAPRSVPGTASAQTPTPLGDGGLLFVRHGQLWRLPAGSGGALRVAGRLGPYGQSDPGYYGYVPWGQELAWHSSTTRP